MTGPADPDAAPAPDAEEAGPTPGAPVGDPLQNLLEKTADPPRSVPAGTAREVLTPEEFEIMTNELARPLYGAALRLCRDRTEAEDLVQETFFRAFRALASFRKGSRFKAWMFRILHNVFINRSKREALAPSAVDPVEITVAEAEHPIPDLTALEQLADVADRHFDQHVKAAVDGMPEVYRAPFVLFALGDLSYAEIAAALDIPIGTVMSRLHRARRLLKKRLGGYAREMRFDTGGRDG